MKTAHLDYEHLLEAFASRVAVSHLANDAGTLMDAARFAAEAHAEVEQLEAYTGKAYIAHSIAVADILLAHGLTLEEVLAGLLHDVREDTGKSAADLEARFGAGVATLVAEATNVSRREDGNRAVRKALDRDHFERGSAGAHNIKLADVTVNGRSIATLDAKFATTYLPEKEELVAVLTKGDARLMSMARAAVRDGFETLGMTSSEVAR